MGEPSEQIWNEAIEAAAMAIDKRREAYEETCATYERGYVPDDDNRVLDYKSIAQLVRSLCRKAQEIRS